MKVLGISTFVTGLEGQWRLVAYVNSQKEFAELLDCSLYYVRGYSGETGNPEEVAFAKKHPHQLIGVNSCKDRNNKQFRLVTKPRGEDK